MDHVVGVLRKLKAYGFRVFMDPHQDLFSRFTGGSGAPFWVLPACGIDRRFITPTQAAFLQFEWPDPDNADPQAFPPMLWATNYSRLAASTLSTMFFAGRDLAPKCIIDGQNIQDWLQGHFIAACTQLAQKVHDAGDLEDSCVIGWDSMNEPNATYIGLPIWDQIPASWPLKMGPMPSPLQSMRLGMGRAQKVQNWSFGALGPKRIKDVVIDPQGAKLWLAPEQDRLQGGEKWGWKRSDSWPLGVCPWGAHGAWDIETGDILDKGYFGRSRNSDSSQNIDFIEEYWVSHWRAYRTAIKGVHKDAITMIQPPIFEPPPKLTPEELQLRACSTQHFYDGLTLITKHWNWFNVDALGILRGKYPGVIFGLKIGIKAIRRAMHDQLGYLRRDTLDQLGDYPTIMGELGTPYDLDKRKTYFGDSQGKGRGDYSSQLAALDTTLRACEGTNILSNTAWTYDPFHSHLQGDQWNGEDFSFWSTDDIDLSKSRQTKYCEPQETSRDTLVGDDAGMATAGNKPSTSPAETYEAHEKAKDAHTLDENQQAGKSNHNHTVWDVTFPSPMGDLHRGGRVSRAFCRPYARATVGTPRIMTFDCDSGVFTLDVELSRADAETAAQTGQITEVYLPMLHYARWAEGNEADSYPELVVGTPVPRKDHTRQPSTKSSSAASDLSFVNEVQQAEHDYQQGLLPGVKGHYEERPWVWGVHVDHSAGTYEIDSAHQILRWNISPSDPIFAAPLAHKLTRLGMHPSEEHALARASLTITRRPPGKLAYGPLQRTATFARNAAGEIEEVSPWSIDFWGTLADVAERALANVRYWMLTLMGQKSRRPTATLAA